MSYLTSELLFGYGVGKRRRDLGMAVPFKSLTKTQINYLRAMEFGHLTQGWGGYGSTLTVRLLEERGLIRLIRYPHIRNGRVTEQWRASLTQAGKDWLAARDSE